jgi:hypothetical protein
VLKWGEIFNLSLSLVFTKALYNKELREYEKRYFEEMKKESERKRR